MPRKLGQEGIETIAFDNRARQTPVQDATPALLPVRIDVENTQNGIAASRENAPWQNPFLFPAIVLKIIQTERKPKKVSRTDV